MKILYLDCQNGVAGDMLLSALLGTGIPMDRLSSVLNKLELKSYELILREKLIKNINTLNIQIKQTKNEPLRHLSDINKIISRSEITDKLKTSVKAVFNRLAEAEAKVHGTTIDKVHFHEVGAVDTIVDIVGVLALIDEISPDKIMCSKVNLGSGFVEFSHGKHPVPAPAVLNLSKGMKVFSTDLGMEMSTPTGMAILKVIVDEFGDIPEGIVQSVGYGSGTKSDDKHPTYLRVIILK